MKQKLLVNIGGGKGWQKFPLSIQASWICMDSRVLGKRHLAIDLSSGEPFPLGDNTVTAYYTSQTLEHVRLEKMPHVFAEMYRTLSPTGKLRIVVPDIRIGMKAYLSRSLNQFSHGPSTPDYYPKTELGRMMSWWMTPDREGHIDGHHMAFDEETLTWFLRQAGFQGITTSSYGKGSEVFTGLDFPRYKDFSIYIEAVK